MFGGFAVRGRKCARGLGSKALQCNDQHDREHCDTAHDSDCASDVSRGRQRKAGAEAVRVQFLKLDAQRTCHCRHGVARVWALGKRTITRTLRALCHPWARTTWIAMYGLDSSSPERRARFLGRVERRIGRN